jgi:hypothetical protein
MAGQTGSKGRKFGRNGRGGAMATYHATRRDLINKSKRMEKNDKAEKCAAAKSAHIVPHGTARALRRQGKQQNYKDKHHAQ